MICRGSVGITFPPGCLRISPGSWVEVVSVPFGLDSLVFCRSETPQLFTVLPEKRTATVGGAIMGSTHIYDMSTVSAWRIL